MIDYLSYNNQIIRYFTLKIFLIDPTANPESLLHVLPKNIGYS